MEIQNSQLAPTNSAESAIIATLQPGSYTATVRGVGETTGVGLVEIYNVGAPTQPRSNKSTLPERPGQPRQTHRWFRKEADKAR